MEGLPDSVSRLLWDVDVSSIDLDRDRSFVFERVMTRGSWEAMLWLRKRYSTDALRAFVLGPGARKLTPRDLAYWRVVSGLQPLSEPGGGRPRWAGP